MKLLGYLTSAQVSEAVGWTLLHSLWQGLIAAAALSLLLVAVRSPRIRYAAGCVALFSTLAAFLVTLIHLLPYHFGDARLLTNLQIPPRTEASAAQHGNTGFPNLAELVPWLAPLWLLGVCLFYARYAAACLSLYRLRRTGVCSAPELWQRALDRLAAELAVSRPVSLLESVLADAPVVLGHMRPVILVPLGFLAGGLPPEQVEAILLHELAHIQRADYFLNACQRCIEGILFYHPAVWWMSRVVRTERENCCDDQVVALRTNAHTYALALAALEQNRSEQNWPTRQPVVAATGGDFMKRIQRLLYPTRPNGMAAPILAALALMAGTAAVMSAWHANPNPPSSFAHADNKVDSPWQKWLNEDVVYIISDEEKAAFENLKTDEERRHFVEQFWARREAHGGPAREEHYRRIAFANKHFAGAKPGWQTDRGRMYIKFGPPDEIDSHPHAQNYQRPESEGGGEAMAYPFEQWVYHHFEGLGSLTVEFVDTKMSGDLRMTLNPKEKYRNP